METEEQQDQRVIELESEISAAKRIIWAMAYRNGGIVSIPNRIMAMANDDSNSIDSSYDAQANATIIKATTASQSQIILN